MATVQENDAAGGAGSLTQALLGVAINGISRASDGYLAKKFPLTSFNERLTVNAEGETKPASAPQANVAATAKAGDILKNPIVIAVGASVVISLLVFLALRAR